MSRPGIEPRSPGPLVYTLTTRPMSRYRSTYNHYLLIDTENCIISVCVYIYIYIYIYDLKI